MRGSLRYDHYRILGIMRNASAHQVKKAYRERVKLCHPDRNGSPEAARQFQAVQEAYETLRDGELRRYYDALLSGFRPVQATTGERPPTRTPGRTRYAIRADRAVNRFAFIGLHVTGLCFGVILITGIVIGITFLGWPLYLLVFCLPGLVVIPDSLAGLRRSPASK